MANLEIQYTDRTLENGDAAIYVTLRGSIDSSTTEHLDSGLGGLLEEHPKAAVDFSEIEYVNSRGMSILIKHSDAVKGAGGMLLLVAVPKKIVATFEVMGLASTFDFVDDENAALAMLAQGSTQTGAAPAPAPSGAFPLSFSCDSCAATLTAGSAGKYRCPRCQSCFEITPAQDILLFPVRSAQMVELNLPCRAKYSAIARASATAISEDLELSAISAELLDRAVDEAMGLYAGKSASGEGRLRVFVSADNREFSIAFMTVDPGLELTSEDEEGLTLRTLRGFVDVVEILPVSPSGQILRLVKEMGD